MAVVRFSGELRNNIANNAIKPFVDQHNKLVESLPLTYGPVMYEKALGAYYTTHMKPLPENFFIRKDNLRIDAIRVRGNDENALLKLPRRMDFPLGQMLPFPVDGKCGTRLAAPMDNYGGGTYIAHADDLQDAEFIEMIRNWLEQLRAINLQREEFVKSVNEITSAFTTLAPALKAWPPLWDLLPEHVREKHREVVEKKKRDPAESLTVDLDKMTGVVVRNKLSR